MDLRKFGAACCFVWITSLTMAQEDSASLIPVVITATRTTSTLEHTNAAVSLINKKQIFQQNSRSVPELLMNLSGVWMQKTGHAGGSPFLRGLTGNQVLLMTDGIRLNNATYRYGPNQYLSTMDPFTVQKAEVVRGVAGTLYGSDAIGGVVNIITSDPRFTSGKGEVHGNVSAKWMSRDMEKTISSTISYNSRNISLEATGSFSDFGDVYAANNKKQTPSSYDQGAFFSKLKYRINDKQILTASFQQLAQQDVDLFDQVTQRGYAISKIDPQKRQLAYLRWEAYMRSFIADQVRVTISRQVSTERRVRQRTNSPVTNYEYDQVITGGVQAEFEKKVSKNWKMINGLDVYSDDVESSAFDATSSGSVNTKRGLYADGSSMFAFSAFSHHQLRFGRFDLTGGLRLNKYTVNIPDTVFGEVSLKPFALAVDAGIMYNINNEWKLTAGLSTGYRTPNVNDLSSFGKFDFGTEVPSPDLEPEKSFNKEIGIKRVSEKSYLHLTAYHNKLTDLIDRVRATYEGDSLINGDKVYTKANTGNAVIYGFEAEFSTWIARSFHIISHVTYTYGQNETANEPIRRIPPVFGRLTGEYHKNNFFIALDWTGAGEQNRLSSGDMSDHRINPEGTPGWGILSARAGYTYRSLSIETGMENILDQAYRIHGSGMDGYGRYAWIRTSFKF
ncbi:MAG TPA: TonB-dependent receptor [Chitinophagaceae bacterium]|nr:TonB-dependent receptor [Chitinophagaceae bacterium]